MASKARRMVKSGKALMGKITHPPYIKTTIPSGKAVAAPPLGPQLGQRGIQIGAFCKDFNEKTSDLKPGMPIPTEIFINHDRSFSIVLHTPTTPYLLMMAAGINKGAMTTGKEIAGKISLKHVYEIASVKSKDPSLECSTMEDICKLVIGTAHSCGIQVVPKLEAEEYGQFLKERQEMVAEQEQELEEKRQAKLLRLA